MCMITLSDYVCRLKNVLDYELHSMEPKLMAIIKKSFCRHQKKRHILGKYLLTRNCMVCFGLQILHIIWLSWVVTKVFFYPQPLCVLYLYTERCIPDSSWSTTQMALQSIYPRTTIQESLIYHYHYWLDAVIS